MMTMFSAIRRRMHVSPATVIATLALVFAMTGGAYAASKYLITSTKQIKPSVLAQLKGRTGPAGVNGANGAQGPQGPTGTGAPGPEGKAGGPGESVASAEVKVGEAGCNKLGGSKFTVGGKETTACNGKEGKEGKEGSPWTAGGNLPPGRPLRGEWGIQEFFSEHKEFANTVSFALPPASAPAVHILNKNEKELVYNATTKKVEEVSSSVCKGTPENPTAPSGTLCVYTQAEEGLISPEVWASITGSPNNVAICEWVGPSGCTSISASRFGFGVVYETNSEPGGLNVKGTWAVTG
jgi:hypothetical protein